MEANVVGSELPSSAEEGWTRLRKMSRSHDVGADGVVLINLPINSCWPTPPRLRQRRRLRDILLRAQPPLLGCRAVLNSKIVRIRMLSRCAQLPALVKAGQPAPKARRGGSFKGAQHPYRFPRSAPNSIRYFRHLIKPPRQTPAAQSPRLVQGGESQAMGTCVAVRDYASGRLRSAGASSTVSVFSNRFARVAVSLSRSSIPFPLSVIPIPAFSASNRVRN